MNRFLSISVLLHILVALIFGRYGFFDHGLDSRKTNPDSARIVSVVIASVNDQESKSLPDNSIAVKSNESPARETNTYKDLAQADEAAAKKDASYTTRKEEWVASNGKKIKQDAVSGHEYFLAGKLTRLPVPLTPVDLNISPINNQAATRPIEITLFIDATGAVSDIVNTDDEEKIREFFDLVALQFKNARFSPGEIDGRKVNSRITITVVSEPFRPV